MSTYVECPRCKFGYSADVNCPCQPFTVWMVPGEAEVIYSKHDAGGAAEKFVENLNSDNEFTGEEVVVFVQDANGVRCKFSVLAEATVNYYATLEEESEVIP